MGILSQPEIFIWMYHPKEARKRLLRSLDYASTALDEISTSLAFAENFADPATAGKLSGYNEKIGGVINVLSLPGTAVKNLQSAMKIAKAVSDLGSIGVINQGNAQFAARAFGKLFSGIGELSHYLPPPINGWFEIFAEAEHFFINLQTKLVPHMKGTHKRIDELARQHGEDRSLFSQP